MTSSKKSMLTAMNQVSAEATEHVQCNGAGARVNITVNLTNCLLILLLTLTLECRSISPSFYTLSFAAVCHVNSATRP